MRPTNEANELMRSGRYRVSGWNQDGSERLMPVAADKLEWVAWDAIRSRQDRQDWQDSRRDRKRLEAQLRDLPRHTRPTMEAAHGATAGGEQKQGHALPPAETPIDKDNYYYLYGKRMRSANETNELVRSGRFRVSGWNPDGSERLMPVAPDNLEWVAWDSIRSRQDRQNRQAGLGRQNRKREAGSAARR